MPYPIVPARYTTLLPQPDLVFAADSGAIVETVPAGGAAPAVSGTLAGVAGASGVIDWTATGGIAGATSLVATTGTMAPDPQVQPALPFADGQAGAVGLALSGSFPAIAGLQQSTITYAFSAPLPAGTTFVVEDPTNGADGYVSLDSVTANFTLSASLNGNAVPTSGWSAANGFGGFAPTVLGAGGGFSYVDTHYTETSLFQRPSFLVTTTAPLDRLTLVTTGLNSFDTIGLAVLAPASSAGMVTATVAGAAGAPLAIAFTTPRDAAFAQPLLDGFTSSVMGGSATVYAAGSQPAAPSGLAGIAATAAFSGSMAGYAAFFTDATGITTLSGGSSANQTVIAGTGGLLFTAGSTGGGQIITGGGDNSFFAPTQGGGAWGVDFGAGSNTVVAGGGSDSIDGGTGTSAIFLGSGRSSVTSEGTDTIIGSTGAANVVADGNAFVAAGTGGMQFTGGAGASTVVAFAGGSGDALRGGSGSILAFDFAPVSFYGGTGASTILGFSGTQDISGGQGGGLFFGAPGGGNTIDGGTGAATIYGGGNGDVLSTEGRTADVIVAGGGAETIDAVQSSGGNSIFLGSGADLVTTGTGGSAIVLGLGAATVQTGSSALLVVNDAPGTGRSVLIDGFDPAVDFIHLAGFAPGAAAAALAGQTSATGGMTLTLPDGTTMIFANFGSLTAGSFI